MQCHTAKTPHIPCPVLGQSSLLLPLEMGMFASIEAPAWFSGGTSQVSLQSFATQQCELQQCSWASRKPLVQTIMSANGCLLSRNLFLTGKMRHTHTTGLQFFLYSLEVHWVCFSSVATLYFTCYVLSVQFWLKRHHNSWPMQEIFLQNSLTGSQGFSSDNCIYELGCSFKVICKGFLLW